MSMEAQLDVDAVMRAYGFKRRQCPVGSILSTTYAEQWVGLLDEGFEIVPAPMCRGLRQIPHNEELTDACDA